MIRHSQGEKSVGFLTRTLDNALNEAVHSLAVLVKVETRPKKHLIYFMFWIAESFKGSVNHGVSEAIRCSRKAVDDFWIYVWIISVWCVQIISSHSSPS